MSLISKALTAHSARLKQSAGESVSYFRGGQSVALVAVPGQTVFDEVESDGEVRTQSKAVDFLVRPSDLVLDGSATEPRRGDWIKRQDGQRFDVMAGPAGVTWEWSDGHQTFMRIHTVRRVTS